GLCVEFTDTLIKHGLEVPELAEETRRKLASVFPDVNTAFRNPVDMGEYGYVPQFFEKALRAVAEDPELGTCLFVRESGRFQMFKDIFKVDDFAGMTFKAIKRVVRSVEMPLIMNDSPNWDKIEMIEARQKFRDKLYTLNIPTITLIPHIARVISELYHYRKYLQNTGGKL
ncbi:MAG: hypothetical protein ACTSU5_19350, partial [Promethearchaeota archaeon]